MVEELMKRVTANDAGAIDMLAHLYEEGLEGLQQDHEKAKELYIRAADLGNGKSHINLGSIYEGKGDLNKAKFHDESAAMAGHEEARCNLGILEVNSGNFERAVKHWIIAASAGDYFAIDYMNRPIVMQHVQ
jgi:TPR repeat protein